MAGNLFMQMFGPMRHVNPRASGLIVFKGGSSGPSLSEIKTAVSEYANPKFDNVFGGQGDIQDDISDSLSRSLDRIRQAEDRADDNFSALSGDINDVGNDVSGISTNVDRGFTDMGRRFDTADRAMDQGFADVGADMKDYSTGVTKSITDRIGQQDIDLGRAFGDINDQVLDSEGNLSKQAQSYFGDLVKNLSGVQTEVNANVDKRVGDLDTRVKDFQTDTGASLDTLGTDLRGGQKNIQAAVDTGNQNATDYFDTLNKGQEGLMSSVGDFSGRFDEFRQQYGDDTMMANRSRNDLLNAVGTSAASTEAAVSDVRSDLGGDIANTEGSILNNLGAMESMLNSNNYNLTKEMRNQFRDVTSSFDDTGKIIANDISANGNQLRRAMDSNGNLIVSEFDNQGTRINQMRYNLDDMMSALKNSSIGSTGLLSAPINRSPYAQT